MSFLFHHRTKKIIHGIWVVVAVFIIVGMTFFFAPGVVETLLF